MKIKVPTRLKVGVVEARIEIIPNIKNDEGFLAFFNRRTGILGIDPSIGDQRDRSFIHEVVHLIDINYECDLTEVNISRLANGFLEVLRDNFGIELDWGEIKEEK